MITIRIMKEEESNRMLVSLDGIAGTESEILTKAIMSLSNILGASAKDYGNNSDLEPEIENTKEIEGNMKNEASELNNTNPADSNTGKPQSNDGNIYFDIPYKSKDEAKKMGARWDNIKKNWYIASSNPNLENFEKNWKRIV